MGVSSTGEGVGAVAEAVPVAAPAFLVHRPEDDVGVAVRDLPAGTPVQGRLLGGGETFLVTTVERISLGHKLALRALAAGHRVVEYGEVIGETTQAIPAGAHVHVHNLRSLRWGR